MTTNIIQIPYAPRGHIYNKKGFSISRSSDNKEIAYYLNLKSTSLGQQLIIETSYRSDLSSSFVNKRTINPIIPYRFITCDQSFVKDLGGTWTTQGNSAPIFNPGLSHDGIGGVTGLPSNLLDNGFIELNLTRDQIGKIVKSKDYLIQRSAEYIDPLIDIFDDNVLVGTHSSIIVNDVQAGMIVKNENLTTDSIYVFLTTQIKINLSCLENRIVDNIPTVNKYGTRKSINIMYDVPVVLKLTIDRTSLILDTNTVNILPSSWNYILGTGNNNALINETSPTNNDWEFSGIINTIEGGTFSTKSWNYNILPGIILNYPQYGSNSSYFFPRGYGILVDGVWDDINDTLFLTVEAASTNKSSKEWRFIRENLVFDFSTTLASQVHRLYHGMLPKKSYPLRIITEYNSNYIIELFNFSTSESSDTILTNIVMFDTSTYSAKIIGITNIIAPDIVIYGSSFILGFYNPNTKSYQVFIAPSLTSLYSSLNGQSISVDNLQSVGFTLVQNISLSKEPVQQLNRILTHRDILYYSLDCDNRGYQLLTTYTTYDYLFPILSVVQGSIIMLHEIRKNYYYKTSILLEGYKPPQLINDDYIGPVSRNNSGTSTLDYYRLFHSNKGVTGEYYVIPQTSKQIHLLGSGNIGYWADPTFTNSDGNGVRCTFYLNSCSGIYRMTDGLEAWVNVIAPGQQGILIDQSNNTTRNDISFYYGGSYSDFVSSAGTAYYWASLTSPAFTFSMIYEGKQLVLDNGDLLAFANYDIDGNTAVHIHARLDLDGVTDSLNRSYTDDGFDLQSVEWAVAIHTMDTIYKSGTVNIKPPSPNAQITSNSTYKTVGSTVDFDVTRVEPTSIRDIIVYKNDTELIKQLSPYLKGSSTSDVITLDLSSINKGEYLHISYKPLYFDSKGTNVFNTEYVTNVTNHKYYLENVSISIGGNDITEELAASPEPYLYLDPGAGSVTVQVSCDIKHEDFETEAYPSALDRVYPIIERTELILLNKTYFPTNYRGTNFRKVPPINMPLTYPNNENSLDLINVFGGTQIATDENIHGGTTIELSTEILSLNVSNTGQYELFLVVEDEFNQVSAWCVSNISENFNIPFRG